MTSRFSVRLFKLISEVLRKLALLILQLTQLFYAPITMNPVASIPIEAHHDRPDIPHSRIRPPQTNPIPARASSREQVHVVGWRS
jgi:hypothetical protein